MNFQIGLHLKKWPWYIKNSFSGYRMETNKWKTFKVHWPYRLEITCHGYNDLNWGLKKSLFSRSRPASCGRGEGDINTQTAILYDTLKKNKMWCKHGATVYWSKARTIWVYHRSDANGMALEWSFERLIGYWCGKIGKQYVCQLI